MYGGKPCSGPEMLAELCNVKDCVTSEYHFKAEQCAATDNVPLNGHSYHWVPSDSAIGNGPGFVVLSYVCPEFLFWMIVRSASHPN